jgi:hypothetical protein
MALQSLIGESDFIGGVTASTAYFRDQRPAVGLFRAYGAGSASGTADIF